MKWNSKTYDVIKWVVQVVMPALITCVGTIGVAVNWPHTELVMTILGALTAFLGASLGVSSAQYYKHKDPIEPNDRLQ